MSDSINLLREPQPGLPQIHACRHETAPRRIDVRAFGKFIVVIDEHVFDREIRHPQREFILELPFAALDIAAHFLERLRAGKAAEPSDVGPDVRVDDVDRNAAVIGRTPVK